MNKRVKRAFSLLLAALLLITTLPGAVLATNNENAAMIVETKTEYESVGEAL